MTAASAAATVSWFPLAATSPAAAQAPEPVLDVSPASVTAGDDVTVTGSCPGGGAGLVQSFGEDESTPDDGFLPSVSGELDVPAGASFAATFTIPEEVASSRWRFSLLCLGSPGTPSSGERFVDVTAATPLPLTLTASPDPARPGEPLQVTGTGCRITGRPADGAIVSLFGLSDGTPVSVEGSVTPAADGTFEVTLDVPTALTSSRSGLSVDCSTNEPGVRYRRSFAEGIDVAVTTTTTSTTAPTTSTTRTLPRTGAPTAAPTPLLSVAGASLVAAGLGLVLAARRRRIG